jgi:hypothetical protein
MQAGPSTIVELITGDVERPTLVRRLSRDGGRAPMPTAAHDGASLPMDVKFLGAGSAYTWLLLKCPGDLNGDLLPSLFEAGSFGLGRLRRVINFSWHAESRISALKIRASGDTGWMRHDQES